MTVAAGALLLALAASARGQPAPAPRRVLSLVPSVTDLIVALGAGDRLVGRTNYDTDSIVARLPSVGGAVDPSLETILVLRPDLVFVWREAAYAALAGRLHALGIATEVTGTETLGELRVALRRVGAVLQLGARAAALERAINDSLAAVRAAMAGRPTIPVLYLIGTNPPVVAGAGTYIDDLIQVAGGRNVLGDAGVKWPLVDLETVLERSPAVIIWPRDASWERAIADLRTVPGWSRLDAVRQGRVVVVDPKLFNRPGPGIARAARLLQQGIAALAPAGERVR